MRYGNSFINRLHSTRYLGIIVDETLSFSDHINCITSKIARNVGIIRKLKHICPKIVLRLLYFSLVHCYLLYCCSVWSSTFQSHLKRLRALQNSAIRILANYGPRDSVRNVYLKLNILPLAGIFLFYRSMLMFDIINNFTSECFNGMFITGVDLHNYNTRNADAFRRPQCETTRSQFSARHVLPSSWSHLPIRVVREHDRSSFRGKLMDFCNNIYQFV